MSLDFKTANARLAQDVIGFCQKYLPDGVAKGDWWLVRVPWRADKSPSLVVHLTSGRWKDLGRDGDRGDLVDLLARVKRCSMADVVRDMGV